MRGFKWLATILLIAIFATTQIFAASHPKGVEITGNGNDYVINFTLPDYVSKTLNVEGEEYIKLFVEGFGTTSEVGLPSLPQLTFDLLISRNEISPRVEIINSNFSSITLDKKIFPFQMPWEKNKSLDDRPFTISKDYYGTKGNIDQPTVKISEPFIIGGAKGVRVTIYPFAYNPAKGELKILKNGSFEIKLNNRAELNFTPASAFSSLYDEMFVNYEKSAVESITGKYLIITDPAFEAGMGDFVAYKSNMGYDVSMVSTDVTGTDKNDIKAYIQALYDDPDTRPVFILLVGDNDDISGWTGDGPDNPNTDLHYVLLDGSTDYYADAFIGRFSVADATDLANIIAKTEFMGTNIGALDKKAIFMAGSDNYNITEGTHNYVIENYFDLEGYASLKLYGTTYNATTQDVIDALNDDQVFAVYSGHGSTTSWADGPPLSQAQVEALTNEWYPFVYSFACVTGEFEYSECFAETWIRTENGGATFYGSSVTSYWNEDDILEKRLFKAWYEDELTQVVPMFDKGKYYLVDYYNGFTSTMIRYCEMYNCMGDPSLDTKKSLPVITHTPINNTEDLDGPYVVSATITPTAEALDPATIKMFYGRDGAPSTEVVMTDIGDDVYEAEIPGNGSSATYNYYITASDVAGQASFAPSGAPANYYSFSAEIDNTPPTITHTALEDVALVYWPAHVTATVTDDFGVEQVEVTYRVNGGSESTFALLNTGGNLYEGDFPIPEDELNIDDVIEYKITASDVSIAGNERTIPVTGFYSFTIIDVAGYILVLNDDPDKGSVVTDEKGTTYRDKSTYGKAANDIAEFLQSKNYACDIEPFETSDFTKWGEYDLLILSSSRNTEPVDNASMRAELTQFVSNGGKILLEGGEIGYDYRSDKDVDFRDEVLHISGWSSDNGENVHEYLPDHMLCSEPNDLPSVLSMQSAPTFYDEDVLSVAADADMVFDWTLHAGDASVISCDNIVGGNKYSHILFYSFNLTFMANESDWQGLLENGVHYLMEDGIVPVELVSFDATIQDSKVVLNWTTATETNNKGFEVEKILLDDSKTTQWEKIGFVEGRGTSSDATNYSFVDPAAYGKIKYRLKQIDFDGSVTYSSEVTVETIPVKFALEQNYPNPFNPSTVIKYSLAAKSVVNLRVYNVLGEVVAQLVNQAKPAGSYKIEWNASNLTSGVYIYTIDAKEINGNNLFRATKKLLLLK